MLSNIFISADTSIHRAVEILNEQHKRIVLIVDSFNKLLGVLTDSDVRRALLSSIPLEQSVSQIMVRNPVTVSSEMSDASILHLMRQKQIHEIPVLDAFGKVVDLKLIDDLLYTGLEAEAFILVGGLGTRLYPITQSIPKPLVKVGGKEILFTIIDGLMEAGVQKITLGLNYKANMIKEAIGTNRKYLETVNFVEEKESLGTAGALSLLNKHDLHYPIIVMNGDILTKVNYGSLLNHHRSEKNRITVALRTEHIKVPYGVVDLFEGKVLQIREKPEVNFFINAGIYMVEPEILDLLEYNRRIDMPDLISKSLEKGFSVGSFPLHEYWIDIGRHSELERATQEYDNIFKE